MTSLIFGGGPPSAPRLGRKSAPPPSYGTPALDKPYLGPSWTLASLKLGRNVSQLAFRLFFFGKR